MVNCIYVMKLFDFKKQNIDRYKVSDRTVLDAANGIAQSNPSYPLTHSERTISTTSSRNSIDAATFLPNTNSQE